jgi:hypothetical protein
MTNKAIVALTVASLIGLAGCTTGENIATGAGVGAAVGAAATNSVGGALIGAGIGAVATAVIVKDLHNGWCTYRAPSGRLYNARCRY